jgi:3'-phosphoadenosine 5'-phosphosulfate sulfotransferase (PAPS reductase)/FAD synthetase
MNDPYKLPEGNVQISFSGGRTSAFMLHQILEANGDLPSRVQVLFANTGKEMEETLSFVNECGVRWGVPITWLEYDYAGDAQKRNGHPTFNVVNHNSASKDGEPFLRVLEHRQFPPNLRSRFCSSELKVRTMKRFLKDKGWRHWHAAVGIRGDEAKRVNYKNKECGDLWYPLVQAQVTKRDVSDFWKSQPFDLQLLNVGGKTPHGNCDMCFLKSEATLAAIMRDMPERAEWWIDIERRFGKTFRHKGSFIELRDFVDAQQDWLFSDEGNLCQADGGDCTGWS